MLRQTGACMIAVDDDHSHAFLRCGKRCIRSEGRPLLDVDTNNIFAYFVGSFFEAIGEFLRAGDSPHPHRSLEGEKSLKLLGGMHGDGERDIIAVTRVGYLGGWRVDVDEAFFFFGVRISSYM